MTKKITHYYKNIPLVDYCRLNNLSYKTILEWINYKGKSVEYAVERNIQCKNGFNMKSTKYVYKGKSLYSILGKKEYNKFYKKLLKSKNKNWIDVYENK